MNSIQSYRFTNYSQKTSQKTNTNNNVSFRAKFASEDIKRMMRVADYPKLYTLLKRFAEVSAGALASIVAFDNNWGEHEIRLNVDGDWLVKKTEYEDDYDYDEYFAWADLNKYYYNFFKDIVLTGKGTGRAMPRSIFEEECWKNRNVTADDILQLAYDAKPKKSSETSEASKYIANGDKEKAKENYSSAEDYYNKALDILHPNKESFDFKKGAIATYEKLYAVLNAEGNEEKAKDVAETLITLKSYLIRSGHPLVDKNESSSENWIVSLDVADYLSDLADYYKKHNDGDNAHLYNWASEKIRHSMDGSLIISTCAKECDAFPTIKDIYDFEESRRIL